jgi:hypothetical protein
MSKATGTLGVTRGPESWAYFYVMLGFALAIEGTVVGMTPLKFPWNVIAYAVIGRLTFWLFRDCAWFQNELIKAKLRYENKAR